MYIRHKQKTGQCYSQNDSIFRTVGMRKMADITIEMKDINQMQNTSSYKMIYIQI